MRQIAMKVAGLTAGAVLMLAAQAHAAVIQVGSASGDAGSTAPVSVTLSTEGVDIAGTQNDIAFMPGARIAAKANGRPDCAVNDAIDKGATTFAFQPSGCSGDACTGVRALVLSFENTTPITDGATLYTCNVAIAADATGDLPLTCSNSGASSPTGGPVAATCTNGTVTVGGGGGPTPTPTEPVGGTVIHVGSASGDAGSTASVSVTLSTGGVDVAGTQNDIAFMPGARIAAKANGRPDCAVNDAIDKGATTFAFQPSGCTGDACTGVRALVLSFENTTPIADGATLYTCNVAIAADATGELPLTCSNAGASSPSGGPIAASCTNGSVMVGGGGPTNTPTATPSPTTSAVGGTPTVTPTGGTAAATATRTPPTVVPPVSPHCDDSCAITSPASGQAGWMLLLPAAILIWMRRRSR